MRQVPVITLTFVAATVLCSCSERKNGAKAAESAPPALDDGANASFEMAAGTWGWAQGDSTCLTNTHTISFTPDRRTMTLTHLPPIDTMLKSPVTTYSVLSAGRGRFLDYQHVVRGAVVDETRRTDTADLVVWDLVLVTPNRYHWHRTDWPDDGMTTGVIRCDGTKPLEQWKRPAPPPPGPRMR